MIRALVLVFLMYSGTSALAQNAADKYYDPREMAEARSALKAGHGAQMHSLLMMERLEFFAPQDDGSLIWDAQYWLGDDEHRLWLKTEGHYELEESEFSDIELHALYSKAVNPFWDLQLGFRHDLKPDPKRNYAVIGLQGLAPHWFEVDASLFFSDEGDMFARFEAEKEFRLTQRLLLQPRIELNAASSDDEERFTGAGLTTAETGLRLRYEIAREFAPYIGISLHRAFGKTADFRANAGEDTNQLEILLGVRFWY